MTTLNRFVTQRFSCNVLSIQALSVSQCDGRQKNTKYIYQGKFNRHDSSLNNVKAQGHILDLSCEHGYKSRHRFSSINTNKSKPFQKIKGAVSSGFTKNICIYNCYKGHLNFQEKKNSHLHTTTTLVYVQLIVYLRFHRCL